MPSKWHNHTPEQRKAYSDQNVAMKRAKRLAKLQDEKARNMLADFLKAQTPSEKRKVIESFAPHYFLLTPNLTKENENETV